jgi:hypothetical protein
VILESLPIALATDFILTGNHDISNRVGQHSSLALLQEISEAVQMRPPNEPHISRFSVGNTAFFGCHHVLTQELFEQQLDLAEQGAKTSTSTKVLLLHCNYDLSFEQGSATLNLTRERAYQLLHHFHYIFLGHEHTHRTDFDGRLCVIGSWRPTAFDNLDDKFVIEFDTDTATYEKRLVWDSGEQVYRGPVSGVSEAPGRQYYLLDDDTDDPGAAQKAVVELFEDGAFGVKLNLGKNRELGLSEDAEVPSLETLPAQIQSDLSSTKPHLLPYWDRLVNA